MSRLESCIMKNISRVTSFFRSNLDIKPSPKSAKLRINCPYCYSNSSVGHKDTDYHMVLNLDWGVAKCFRCGAVHPIITVMNKVGLKHKYLDLLSEISSLSLYDLQNLIRHSALVSNKEQDIRTERVDLATKFIKDNCLVPANRMTYALEYAKSRTRNNANEISLYYADESYIYVPIFKDRTIVAFIARLYNEGLSAPRYKYIKLYEDDNPVAFIDEVEENISSDTIYITEGYFDALAINNSFNDYCAVAIFSKANVDKVIQNFYSIIPEDTKIVITLDSIAKDSEILSSIDLLYSRLQKYFHNIFVCMLPEHDPSYVFTEEGPRELIRQIMSSTISSKDYQKKRILLSRDNKSKSFSNDSPLAIPDYLLRAKERFDRLCL